MNPRIFKNLAFGVQLHKKLLVLLIVFSFTLISGLTAQTENADIQRVVIPDPPPWVNLLSPSNNSTVNDTAVTFYAEHSQGVDYANFRLYSDSTLSNLIHSASMTYVSDQQHMYTYEIPNTNATYYWNVYCQKGMESATSVTWSFNYNNTGIAEFYLSNIVDSTHLVNHHPTINWRLMVPWNIQSAYQLQMSTFSDTGYHEIWDSGFIESTDTSIVYNGPPLQDSVTYYMQLRVEGSEGVSDWRGLTFTMNSVPDPHFILPVNDDIVHDPLVKFTCSDEIDSEGDTLLYEFRLYKYQGSQMENILNPAVLSDSSGWISECEWTNTATLTENTSYFCTVQASDTLEVSKLDTTYIFVNQIEEDPSDFTPVYPSKGAIIDTNALVLTWNTSLDPDPLDSIEYVACIKYLDDSGDIPELKTININTGQDTCLLLNVGSPISDEFTLRDHESYYWNVLACDKTGNRVQMTDDHQSFTVNLANNTPSDISLISPDSVVVISKSVNFSWSKAMDPDPGDMIRYELTYLDKFDGPDSILCDSNYCRLDTLKENHEYTWYVSAYDLSGGGSHSDSAVFWLDHLPEAPLPFSTESPADNSQQDDLSIDFVWKSTSDPDPFDEVEYTLIYTKDISDTLQYAVLSDIADTTLRHTLPESGTYFWKVVARDQDGFIVQANDEQWMKVTLGQTAIADTDIPSEFILYANYPNPFNPSTTIDYDIPENTHVSLNVFNIKGQLVESLVNEDMSPGRYSLTWNAADLGTGVYIFRLHAGDFIQIKKALLIK